MRLYSVKSACLILPVLEGHSVERVNYWFHVIWCGFDRLYIKSTPDDVEPISFAAEVFFSTKACYAKPSIIDELQGLIHYIIFSSVLVMDKLKIGDTFFVEGVDKRIVPAIERELFGKTRIDLEIESLSVPNNFVFISIAIRMIRWYQNSISSKIGNRCVFDPSCSHYCELAIRNFGLCKGIYLTSKRLLRCRTGAGGVDMPPLK